jgi:hypothetical protein
MTTAFVLGNGESRRAIDPAQLRLHGPIYACNAIYREFVPDVLIATDRPIAMIIQQSGYAQKNRFHTRRPEPGTGALHLHKSYMGFSSGPNAVGLACRDGYETIYMLGFDLGTTTGEFNNVYADTEFYKKKTDPPTFAGNWMRQILQICNEHPAKNFIRVMGRQSVHVPMLAEARNMQTMQIEEFQALLNSTKGVL